MSILDIYDSLDYTVYKRILNVTCYGSATKRERMIIVAVRNDFNLEYEFLKATHEDTIFIKNIQKIIST